MDVDTPHRPIHARCQIDTDTGGALCPFTVFITSAFSEINGAVPPDIMGGQCSRQFKPDDDRT